MSTMYDLTSAQNLLSMQQKYTLYRQCNNICTTVLFDKTLDFEILKKAIEIAYDRNDAFRIRITRQGKKEMQYFANSGLQDIELLDYSGKTREEMEHKFSAIARKRITYHDKPLSKIYLVKSFDGKTGVCFINSHIMMDSWAVTVFYKDLFEVYEALLTHSDMPKPIVSYEKLMQRDLDYPNTPKYKSDYEFWKNDVDTGEPIYTDVNGSIYLEEYRRKKKNPALRSASNLNLLGKSANLMLLFPREIVEKATKYCSDNGFSMQHLFFLAYRSYLSKVNNREKDVLFYISIARRGTLEEKNSGGTRVHAIHFRTILEENTTFREAIVKIGARQSALYRHADFSFMDILKLYEERYKISQIESYCGAMFTFQPLNTTSSDGSATYTNWYDNGSFSGIIYLTVMDGDGTGALKCYYQHRIKRISEDTIKKLHYYMQKFFLAGLEDDSITIDSLLDIE